jgi:predicted NUDIX family phosphoesterase
MRWGVFRVFAAEWMTTCRRLRKENNFFVPRSAAEEDPSLKQIIPYAVFRHGGRILHYTRGAKSGEKRLVAKSSIGIGGHVNDTDECQHFDQATYHNAVRREIGEELRLGGGFSERAVALINDDSSEVGRVHLGIVHIVDLENDTVSAGRRRLPSWALRLVRSCCRGEMPSRHGPRLCSMAWTSWISLSLRPCMGRRAFA